MTLPFPLTSIKSSWRRKTRLQILWLSGRLWSRTLRSYQRMSGLTFFPAVERREELKNLCDVDSCQLMDFKRFTLYISGRKVASARTTARLDKIMTELKDAGITPDEYLSSLYLEKKRELAEKEEREKKPEQ
ncbi:hypothetical protein M9458_047297 [Cirrhinus mrigala]|uniref:EXOG C-terminal domain-containing protein n=1 Tax=Cirrhinus mrigala TaxID=683832 RepID=A0ABD0N5B1_CIRMR